MRRRFAAAGVAGRGRPRVRRRQRRPGHGRRGPAGARRGPAIPTRCGRCPRPPRDLGLDSDDVERRRAHDARDRGTTPPPDRRSGLLRRPGPTQRRESGCWPRSRGRRPGRGCAALADRVPATGAKVAPGIDHGALPAGTQAEWISVGGDLVEAGVWWGPLREGAASRRATVLATRHRRTGAAPNHPPRSPSTTSAGSPSRSIGPVSAWLVEPDPAVIRAGLVSVLARTTCGAPARPPDRLRRLRRRAHRGQPGRRPSPSSTRCRSGASRCAPGCGPAATATSSSRSAGSTSSPRSCARPCASPGAARPRPWCSPAPMPARWPCWWNAARRGQAAQPEEARAPSGTRNPPKSPGPPR